MNSNNKEPLPQSADDAEPSHHGSDGGEANSQPEANLIPVDDDEVRITDSF